jgi:hypothetical protein
MAFFLAIPLSMIIKPEILIPLVRLYLIGSSRIPVVNKLNEYTFKSGGIDANNPTDNSLVHLIRITGVIITTFLLIFCLGIFLLQIISVISQPLDKGDSPVNETSLGKPVEPLICRLIENQTQKDNCIAGFAENNLNPSLCDLIKTDEIKNNCYEVTKNKP